MPPSDLTHASSREVAKGPAVFAQNQRPRPYQPPPPSSSTMTIMIRSVVVSTLPSSGRRRPATRTGFSALANARAMVTSVQNCSSKSHSPEKVFPVAIRGG
jgi:hypothetical protein